jgi:predicted Abi (CAAX) family protease
VRWLDQEVGTSTTFRVVPKPVAAERYLWLLAPAALVLLLFVLWKKRLYS